MSDLLSARAAIAYGRRPKPRSLVLLFRLMLVLALSAGALLGFGNTSYAASDSGTCPGGYESGAGSSSGHGTCPDLHNDDILAQETFPRTLYRGDSRSPQYIFNHGFASRGTSYDIVAHVQGDRAGNSGYISTTGTLGVADTFARSQGMRNLDWAANQPRCSTGRLAIYALIPGFGQFLMERCQRGLVTAESFVYTIDPLWATNALHVPDQIRGNQALYNQYASQDEWAYAYEIPNYAITGVRIYTMTAYATNGVLDLRTLTFAYDRWIPNPNHLHRRISNLYNPANDPSADWNFETYLDTPEQQANSWNRGCNAIDQCRGGTGG